MSLTSTSDLDLLQKKITTLETENEMLRTEASQLARAADDIEKQKRKMLMNLKDQLKKAREENNTLLLELNRLQKENESQIGKTSTLEASLSDAYEQIRCLSIENAEKTTLVTFTIESKGSLAKELVDCKANYQEVLTMLEKTQNSAEKLKNQKKRTQPSIRRRSLIPAIAALTHSPADSLHAELIESSLFNGCSLDSGVTTSHGSRLDHTDANKNASEMVRSVNKMTGSQSPAQPLIPSLQCGTFSRQSLEAALKRLRPVRHTHASPRTHSYDQNSNAARDGFSTPQNCTSTRSSNRSRSWRKKLELVVSLDDSQTLLHWTLLGTPSLAAVLEESSGVRVRAACKSLRIDINTNSVLDVEEDPVEVKPDQHFLMSDKVHMYLKIAFMNPDDDSLQKEMVLLKSMIPMNQQADIEAVAVMCRMIQRWMAKNRPWQHPPEHKSKTIKSRRQQNNSTI